MDPAGLERYLSSLTTVSLPPESSNDDSTEAAACSSNSQSRTLGKRRANTHEESHSEKRRKPGDCRRLWHPEWEVNFLVVYDKKNDTCTCLKCNNKIETVKKYALQRHCESVHPDTKDWSSSKHKLFVEHAKHKLKQMQQSLAHTLIPSKLPLLASYKLGFTLVKQQKALSLGEAVVDWAASSDPESKIFKSMPKSRQTLTRRVSEIGNFIQGEITNSVKLSLCWGIQMDESTDKADHCQVIMHSRFANMESCCISTNFLTILRIERSPNAENIFKALNEFVEKENLPKEKLVSFSSDGASVM